MNQLRRPAALLLLSACLLVSVALPGQAHAGLDGKRQELEDVRGRIAQLREEVERAAEDRKDAADGLRESELRISQVNQNLRTLQRDERKLAEQLRRLGGEESALLEEIAAQEQRLATLLRRRHAQGGADSARVLLSGRNPAEIQRDLDYLAYIGRARAALIRDHKQTLVRLAEVKAEIGRKRAGLQGVKRDRHHQLKELDGEKQTRRDLLARLSDQIREQRREIGTLVRDEARLARLIERLRRLASMPKKTAKPARKGESKPGMVVDRVTDATYAGERFANLRGKLALPVAGEIRGRFGQAREGGGPAWKGLYIRTVAGREVRAVGSGEVVFADWLRGFGNLLIIDHGDGYHSLYSNNESLYKQPGDGVRAGDVIASVGSTGGQETPGLYFELRRQGQPFDPLSWVK